MAKGTSISPGGLADSQSLAALLSTTPGKEIHHLVSHEFYARLQKVATTKKLTVEEYCSRAVKNALKADETPDVIDVSTPEAQQLLKEVTDE